mgnify:CR=1 FL=1
MCSSDLSPTVAVPGFNQVVMPTGDGSKFSNADDGFLDAAIPLDDLVALTKADLLAHMEASWRAADAAFQKVTDAHVKIIDELQ